ncbi:MAG: Gfo/Idh/MocA family oxidoreductase [Alphaproteobacteria bacterium]|nr:Gfo/Idh/MocA family oxidoreductase [Alphaproteobacteria bacterium]
MNENPILKLIGRRLRLAVIGGGGVGLIGPVHRLAARLDDRFEVTASVLSSDPAKGRAEGKALGLARPYGTFDELLAGERGRADAIDAVAIMTPNDSHERLAIGALEAGFHVMCDKPVANDLAAAKRVAAKVRASGKVFCLTHNYSGYPMVRQARAMALAGELGPLRLIQSTYVQGSLATKVEDKPESMMPRLKWRLDPARGGPSHVLLDIGTHAHQLACFASGRRLKRVMAQVGAVIPGRNAHDTASALIELEGGVQGVLWVSKAAAGAENALSFQLYGESAGLYWEQASHNHLRFMRNGEAAQILSRGLAGLHPLAKHATRIPPGHPEGLHEAFANLYADFAEAIAARMAGKPLDPLAAHFPNEQDAVDGLAFVEACLESSAKGRWVDL